MKIADIRVGKRHRERMGDIEGLARSIANIGLLQPIVVRPDRTLVAGQRRLAACQWRVTPLNDEARRWVPAKHQSMTERQWVSLLYRMRGYEMPVDLFEHLEVAV